MNLKTFLKQHQVRKASKESRSESIVRRRKITHTSLSGGSYSIPDEQQDLFVQLYMGALDERRELSLIERPLPKYGPVLVDIDLNYTLPEGVVVRGYDATFIETSVTLLIQTVKAYLELHELRAPNICDTFITEKCEPTLKKTEGGKCVYKDGFHIYSPYIIADADTRTQIRAEYVEKMEDLIDTTRAMLEERGGCLNNEPDDIIDKCIISSNGMMMYGSSKPDCPPYTLKTIFRWTGGKMVPYRNNEVATDLTPFFVNRCMLIKLLSIRRPFADSDIPTLTNNGMLQVAAYRTKQREEHERANKKNGTTRIVFSEDLDFTRGLVELLSPKRATSYSTWMEVGWCLHNIDHRLLPEWISFSQQDPRYADTAEHECEEKWDTMEERDLSMGTLHYWARNDSPREYKKYVQTSLEYEVRVCAQKLDPMPPPDQASGGGQKGKDETSKKRQSRPKNINEIILYIARVVHRARHHQHVCAAYQARCWFKFNGIRWVADDGGVSLRTYISTDLVDIFSKSAEKYRLLIRNLDPSNEESHARYERLANACTKIAEKLVVTDVKKKLMEEMAEHFYWQNDKYNTDSPELRKKVFEEILDKKLELIGMGNGVYDLNRGTMRQGRCEDFITLSTGLDFDDNNDYSWEHPEVQEVMWFFSQVLTDMQVRNYILTLLASFMDGNKGMEQFHIWNGGGGNGKSKIIELYQQTLGEYCGTANITLLTGKRADSSAPTPDLLATKGKRFIVLQEPNENEKIQVGKMKELSGGDKITCRGLYQREPLEFKPQFTMCLTCNHLPSAPADDGGTWRRMRVTNFESTFTKVEELSEHQRKTCKVSDKLEDQMDVAAREFVNEAIFPVDYNLASKFERWRTPFFWILTEFYKVYKNGGELPGHYPMGHKPIMYSVEPGVHDPPAVENATKKYRKSQDTIGEFIDDMLQYELKSTVTIRELFPIYNTWFRNAVLPGIPFTKSKLEEILVKKWGEKEVIQGKGKRREGVWMNYRIKTQEEQKASADAAMKSVPAIKSAMGNTPVVVTDG